MEETVGSWRLTSRQPDKSRKEANSRVQYWDETAMSERGHRPRKEQIRAGGGGLRVRGGGWVVEGGGGGGGWLKVGEVGVGA